MIRRVVLHFSHITHGGDGMTYTEALSALYGLIERIDKLAEANDPKEVLRNINSIRVEIHTVADQSDLDSEINWAITGLDDLFIKACNRYQVESLLFS